MPNQKLGRTQEQRQWQELLRQIRTRGDILAGTLSSAYLPCNKGHCKCTRGQLHGPSWRLGYSQAGQSTTVYVRADDLLQVKAATARYAQMRGALRQAASRNLRALLNKAKRRHARRRGRRQGSS
jgi:hypothetical protein